MEKVCRDFMNKRCEREHCRFIHDAKLCANFWKRGTCKWKENCRKNHFVTATQPTFQTKEFQGMHPERQQMLQANVPNRNEGRDKRPKKVRNTESWDAPAPPYDMRVQFETAKDKLGCHLGDHDVLVAKNVFSDFQMGELHDKLVKEIQNCDIPKEDLLKLWHGNQQIPGTHLICDDSKNWKAECPTFTVVINRLIDFFGVKPSATRLNWYTKSDDFKPYHRDRSALYPEKQENQNITIACSFGQTRDVVFQNLNDKRTVCIPQADGEVYTFGNQVNIDWRHGISKGEETENASRISIIIWGLI
jgi:hypothetical protein